MPSRALIARVTGLIGGNGAAHPVSKGREVRGIACKPPDGVYGVRPTAADMLEPETFRSACAGVNPIQWQARS
jgi:hypothetical protein